MKRRTLLSSAVALGLANEAGAQSVAVRRIGLVSVGTDPDPMKPNPVWVAFLHGLDELGWSENRNIAVDRAFAGGNSQLLPSLVNDLGRRRPEIVVVTGEPEAKAAVAALPGTAVVMVLVPDPVGVGLVESLARPGGFVTGLSTLAPEIYTKRLQLLQEMMPGLDRVGVIVNPALGYAPLVLRYTEQAAQGLSITVQLLEVRRPEDVTTVFDAMERERPAALLVVTDGVTYNQRQLIAQRAATVRAPAMFENRFFVDAGGLVSYGPSYADLARRAAGYVHRILGGAKPRDLPIEQPTKFEMVINLKTAKTLGLTISPTILARADEVIE